MAGHDDGVGGVLGLEGLHVAGDGGDHGLLGFVEALVHLAAGASVVLGQHGVQAPGVGLPAGRRRLIDVLPGVLLTLALWLVGALLFAYYLAAFANYAATYAGLASIMIVLVFLYMVGAIFIIGAEFNAALMKFKVVPVKTLPEGGISNPDHGADI